MDGVSQFTKSRGNVHEPQLMSRMDSKLVSWWFESSQPQRIISVLKTNFNRSPGYSFHRSLYRKSLFLKPQLRLYPQFRNANPEKQNTFWGLFIFRGNSTRAPASSRVTHFILWTYTGTDVSQSQHRKISGEVLEKMQVNGSEG